MPLPDLCLLPHEVGDLAPGEPLCAPATHRLTSKKHPQYIYLVRRVRMENDPKHIWMARRESVPDAPLLREERSTSDLKQLFANLMRGKLERRLFFDRELRLAATRDWHFSLRLNEAIDTSWQFSADRKIHLDSAFRYYSRFRWPRLANGEPLSRRWCAEVSDAQLEKEVAEILRAPDSDGAFTFRWLQLSKREREALLFSGTRENFERFEQMLRWILQSDDRWSGDFKWTWVINLDLHFEGSFNYAEAVASFSEIHGDTGQFSLSARLSRLLQLAVEHFAPSFNKAFTKTSVFQAIWSRDYSEWHIPVVAPTAHERLEAQFQLRAFLRDKVSSTELAELMGQ